MTSDSNTITKLFSVRIILGVLILCGFIFSYWHWLGYQQFTTEKLHFSNHNRVLTIAPGSSISQLGNQWYQRGIVNNRHYFKLFYTINPQFKAIKAGEYQLDKEETLLSLMNKLHQGKVIQHAVTIIEGTNSFQILKSVRNNSLLTNDLDPSASELHKQLGVNSNNIEGWLFPDTYYFSKNEPASRLLKRSVNKMQKVLAEEWANREADLPYSSPYEALIMASIIEKETAIEGERDLIAGVFVRRLRKKMRLGTDPTVIYGIGPDFNGDITYKDLRTKTPYNTYIIKGLPPTPIAMPGRESIYAALHPAKGTSLYFVADGSGGHYFSDTLSEHNKAVKRYLRLQKKRQQ